MAPISAFGVTRASKAAATAAATKAKDELNKAPESSIKDADTAMAYLITGDLKSEDDELSFESLSIIAMQLSQQPRFPQHASEAFKALSYLIHDLQQKRTIGEITDVIAKAVSAATKRVRNELEEATEAITAVTITATNTAEELREECRSVVAELKDVVEGVATALVNNENVLKHGGQQGGERGDAATYADSVRVGRQVPIAHAAAVARAELQKRKIRLVKAAGMEGAGMEGLSEKQLVEKANMALELMVVVDEDKPDDVWVVGANKDRGAGAGGVTFELNSGEAVCWLKDKDVMLEFLSKMGSTADFKEQSYEVVMDWVPVTFEAESPAVWTRVEQSNGLRSSAIKGAKWIKPTHLRSVGQRTAIAIFSFATREDANHVIENGLYVEGKKVWGRKQVQEPRRCLKCQCFGEHKAVQCTAEIEVCGRCGGKHRTSTCVVKDRDMMECSNCRASANGKQRGHGAADRRCPTFLGRLDRLNKTRKENNYRYFCTTDPATWETNLGNNEENQFIPDSGNGGDLHLQGGARGRLGGRGRGEGGGVQGGVDNGWGGVKADTRAGGNRFQVHGGSQIEPTNNGNAQGVASGSKGKAVNTVFRNYRTETQNGQNSGPTQTTLSDLWKGADNNTRSWSEDIAWREQERNNDSTSRQQNDISYV